MFSTFPRLAVMLNLFRTKSYTFQTLREHSYKFKPRNIKHLLIPTTSTLAYLYFTNSKRTKCQSA